jgi:phosphohistidine phosphatase
LPENVQRVMLVGHNPDVEEFVNTLTGETASMPTAAVAWIELPIQRWVDAKPGLTGKLLKVWRPKDLPENAD